MDVTVQQVETRWHQLNKQLEVTKKKIMYNVDHKKFYDELASLTEVADGYDMWVSTAGPITEEAMEISRQLEQCRVRKEQNR